MPRWLFLALAACLALSVVGTVLIVFYSPTDAQRAAQRAAEPTPQPVAPAAPVPGTGGGGTGR